MENNYNIFLLAPDENKDYCDKALLKEGNEIVYLSDIPEVDQLNIYLFNLIDLDCRSGGGYTRRMGYHGIGIHRSKYTRVTENYSDKLVSIMRSRAYTIYLIKRMYCREDVQYLAFFCDKIMHTRAPFGLYDVKFSDVIKNFVEATGEDQTFIENNFGFISESNPILK